MKPARHPEVVARMRMAFELAEAAEQMMRQNLRRRHPEASDEELERLFAKWLHHRPGAELGDGVGQPSDRFRFGE